MNIIHATDSNFDDSVKEGFVLVDFYAGWCGPCKMLAPILEEYANETNDVKVVKVNVEEAPNTANNYQIMSIPTLVLFKDGNIDSTKQGFQTKDMLKTWVDERK
ncbi:MAG: thioredoxin [Bacilli bacterium]